MSLVINLTETEEVRLANEAKQSGLSTAELVETVLREHLAARDVRNANMVRAK